MMNGDVLTLGLRYPGVIYVLGIVLIVMDYKILKLIFTIEI